MYVTNVNVAQICYIPQTCEKVRGDMSLYKCCTFV